MGSDVPKQFHLLNGRPIIFHTIEKFINTYPEIEVIVVLPSDYLKGWEKLCLQYKFGYNVKTVEGGAKRYFSVKNGLQLATGDLIAIHDAVRPLVKKKVIEDCFKYAEIGGAAIPVIKLKNSLRKITFDESRAVDRDLYCSVQTPQVFRSNVVKIAYDQEFNVLFSDDSSVVEACGHDVLLVVGNEENIKITLPIDLKIAEVLSA